MHGVNSNVRDFFFLLEQVEKAHDADLHCVDWNPHDVNFILTGYLHFLGIIVYLIALSYTQHCYS